MFTWDPDDLTLTIETSDINKIADYELKITGKHEGRLVINGISNFTVIVADPCATALLSISPSIIPSYLIEYSIG